MQRGAFASRQLVRTNAATIWGLLGFVALDRIIKLIAFHLSPASHGGLFFVSYFLNRVGPLSSPLPTWLLLALGVLAVAAVFVFAVLAWRSGSSGALVGLALVLTGGLSNLLDRFAYGGVIDLFHLTLWGTLSFNLADLGLVVGLVLVAVCSRPTPRLAKG